MALAAWVVLAATECATAECATAGEALVDALAMVSPRPRLAPRTPVAMAGPASDREILMVSSCHAGASGTGGSGAGHLMTR